MADDLVGELAQDDVSLLASGLEGEAFVVVFDQEVVEQGEVEQSTLVLGQVVVADALAVDQQQGLVEDLHDVVDLDERDLLPAFDFGSLELDASLFLLHGLDRDAVAVVELQQLLVLSLQVAQPSRVAVGLVAGDLCLGVHRVPDGDADEVAFGRGQPGLRVDAFEVVFDLAQADAAGAAWSAGVDAAEAGVVLVDRAELAAVTAVAVVLAALAGQLSAEVVLVLAAPAAAGALGGKDRLDLLEGFVVDDRRVPAGAADAVERHHARVVVVRQQPMDGGAPERL